MSSKNEIDPIYHYVLSRILIFISHYKLVYTNAEQKILMRDKCYLFIL